MFSYIELKLLATHLHIGQNVAPSRAEKSLLTCHPRQAINNFDGSEALQLV
jgi:hypothetical protein